MARLSREFYNRDTLTAACELLGKYVVRRLEGEPSREPPISI